MPRRSTKEEFIRKAKLKHGTKYDYSKVIYKNNTIKVEIICPEHGVFPQMPLNHLRGSSCPTCGELNRAEKRRSTKEEFIRKAKLKHGTKYDYSKVVYISSREDVEIICPEHGIFPQVPQVHLSGSGCTTCGELSKSEKLRSTKEEFIEKAELVHGTKYDYSKVVYITAREDVEIICPEHGIFPQTPTVHLSGSGCPTCAGNIQLTKEEFIEKAELVHGTKYDYSKVIYISTKEDVEIICPEHGVFPQVPQDHLSGSGCPTCGKINGAEKRRLTKEEFIEKAELKHGTKYDYSKVIYEKDSINVEIICHKHGIFLQTPHLHLVGCGCPTCNESKGEKYIREFLIKNKIKYEEQKRFKDCKYKKPLPFDFYLFEYKIFIEYQGKQHTKYTKHFHRTEEKFLECKNKDKIKKEYAMNNGIYMEIHYNDDMNARLETLIKHINSVEST